MHVVAIYPKDGCGVGLDPDCSVPTNATLVLRFDRFLNPYTANRQALRVYTGDPEFSPPIPFEVVYDPVERVVEYRMPPGYQFAPHTLYQLELVVPGDADAFGIRAFDGAPLAEAGLPLRSSFFTAGTAFESQVGAAPSCREIVQHVLSFESGGCAAVTCHRASDHESAVAFGDDAPYGLLLDSEAHFARSTIDRIARETEVGDVSGGVPARKSDRFGVRMALVEPRNPGGSYLLYKLLRNRKNFGRCGGSATSPFCDTVDPCRSSHAQLPLLEGECVAPPTEELDRLREWFVRGDPMPSVGDGIGLEGLRAVSRFIAAGAECPP